MNRTLKAVIVAVALIIVGAVLAGCSLWGLDGAWDQLSGKNNMVTTQETITGEFTNIDVDVFWLDVQLIPSSDGTSYYKATTYDSRPCTVTVENGTLMVRQQDNRKWHQHIGIYWEKTSLQVYLPEDTYGQLTIQSDTSDVTIPAGFTFENITITTDTGDVAIKAQVDGDLNITCSTGDIRLVGIAAKAICATTSTGDMDISQTKCDNLSISTTTGYCQLETLNVAEKLLATSSTGGKFLNKVDCGSLSITGTTGDTRLNNVKVSADAQMESTTGDWKLYNVTVSGDAKMESDTGEWEFNRFDAANITIDTDTGDVEGTLLSDKIFFVDTDTGDVEVPRTTTGGKCEITTDTGDIEIEIVP